MTPQSDFDNHEPPTPDLGARIKSFRLMRGLSLAQVAAQTPLSEGTLSRIENGRSDVSAQNLYPLARAFDVEISAFFEDQSQVLHQGARAVTRRGEGLPFRSQQFVAQVLASELSAKQMFPFLNSVTARTLEDVGGLHAHEGEEFLLVLSGKLVFHCDHYTPLLLAPGDSVYFEASCGHAYVNGSEAVRDETYSETSDKTCAETCEFLVVTTQSLDQR